MYIDKLDDIVNKYNNIYHSTIKIKPADVKNNLQFDSGKKRNDKDPKFKVGGHVRISNAKTFSLKDTLQIGQKKLW